MDDFAHKETERILSELERKIKALYADASRDMKKKADWCCTAGNKQMRPAMCSAGR